MRSLKTQNSKRKTSLRERLTCLTPSQNKSLTPRVTTLIRRHADTPTRLSRYVSGEFSYHCIHKVTLKISLGQKVFERQSASPPQPSLAFWSTTWCGEFSAPSPPY